MQRARSESLNFNQLFTLFTLERLLYRLGESPYAERFVLKGGLMMRMNGAPLLRPTRDIDLEGVIENDPQALADVFREIVRIPCPEDGLDFFPDEIQARAMQLETAYGGVRIVIPGGFGSARFSTQVDVGFGDEVTPAPIPFVYPNWLGHLPSPKLWGYPAETTIAEKYETIFRRREANSRVKDWFDLWLFAKTQSFEGSVLQQAISNTFHQRSRPFEKPGELYLAIENTSDRVANWKALVRTLPSGGTPEDLKILFAAIGAFLDPVMNACLDGKRFDGRWDPERQVWTKG